MWRVALVLAGCGRVDFAAIGDATGEVTLGDAATPDAFLAAGLVAYYPMDQLALDASQTARITVDATGHGHDGSCVVNPEACPVEAVGLVAGDHRFDGVADIITVPSAADLETSNGFTVAGWLDADPVAAVECPFTKGLGSGRFNSWALCLEADRSLYFYTVHGTDEDTLLSPPDTIATGEWHHVAITWDGATKRLWYDGVAVVSDPAITDFDGSDLYIGNDVDNGSPVSPYAGMIDELRIYDRVLSSAELAALATP